MSDLVEQLDQYNTQWMQEAFVELEDSINEVKQVQFGKEIYEAVAKTFEKNFSDTNATLNALKEAEQKLEETTKELNESKKLLESADREHKMNLVLENLHGRPREIMEHLLRKVPTNSLEDGYNKFIGRVLSEGNTEKESVKAPVLAESEDTSLKEGDIIKTGDTEKVVNESKTENTNVLTNDVKARLEKMAGIID